MTRPWTGIRWWLAWPFALLLMAHAVFVGFLILQVIVEEEPGDVGICLSLVPLALAAAWQAWRAPAMTRRLTQVALLTPVVVAAVSFLLFGWLAAGYLLLALTVHLGWSLPWAATMAHLSGVTGRRLKALWALALAAPLAVGLDLLVSLVYLLSFMRYRNNSSRGPLSEAMPPWPFSVMQLLALSAIAAVAWVSWRVRRANPLPGKEVLRAAAAALAEPTDAERAAAADPQAMLARDLLAWKRRFLLLPAVGVGAGAWLLATHIGIVKRQAKVDMEAILAADTPPQAPGPLAEATTANGLLQIRPVLQDAPQWPAQDVLPGPLSYAFPMQDPAAYEEGSPLRTFIADTQPLYDALPAMLVSADHSLPAGYLKSTNEVVRPGKIGYALAARIHLHCYRQDWPALQREVELIAALNDYDRETAASFGTQNANRLFSLWAAEQSVGLWLSYNPWSMPATLLDSLRLSNLARLETLEFRAETWQQDLVGPARFHLAWTTALGLDDVYDFDKREEGVAWPLVFQMNALHYRWSLRQVDQIEQQMTERMAASVAAGHYLGRTDYRFAGSLPLSILMQDYSANVGRNALRDFDFTLRSNYFNRLAQNRLELAVIDAARHYLRHGRFPADMEALGEPELRRDPYSPADAPFSCRVDDQGRLRIWSVGTDQGDDKGWIHSDPPSESETRRRRDEVIMLCPPGWQEHPFAAGPKSTDITPVRSRP